MTHKVWFNDHLSKLNISQETFLLFLAILVGVLVGSLAVFFRMVTDCLVTIILINWKLSLPHYIALIPLIGGLLVGLVIHYGGHRASGHGIPEAIQAVALQGGRMKGRTIFVEGIASILTISFGGSVGRVGPVVEIGAGVGSLIGQFFDKKDEVVKMLLGCGAAAGIAAIFNAPISGVIFALEIILGDFTPGNFSMLVISSVSADIIARTIFGDRPALIVEHSFQFHYSELIFYMGLGIMAAIVGMIFIRTLYYIEDLFKKIPLRPEWLKPALGGLSVGIIGMFLPQVFGVGFGEIHQILNNNYGIGLLVAIMVFKLLATCLSIGSGMSGGVFAPTLLIGASMGDLYGSIVQHFFSVDPKTYALVGMGTILAGVSHAPITAVMMIFEMTRNYQIILPLLVASVIANLLSRLILKDNIYTMKLRRRGLIIHKGYDLAQLMQIQVFKAMSRDVDVVKMDEALSSVVEKMEESHHNGFPVVNDAGEMVGIITRHDLNKYSHEELKRRKVKEVMTDKVKVVYPDETLDQVLLRLVQYNVGRMPVVERNNPTRILGVITRKDIVDFYQNRLLTEKTNDKC
ncbi:hypothetical protein BBF96_14490 [Anoxybacter fermentans]|uniref:CBS domain-containing protein n=1 Tax=Anoxybacter fermentans TaxID=1323375 RepID=A0A3S9T1W3_9FIRM|nr:chloride channel protein [Anoxybacter fermentans]AZR74485.1 hypothetical protein BBF96_14490 [Anoxybacter fermentans]